MNYNLRLSIILVFCISGLFSCSKITGNPSISKIRPIEHTHFSDGSTLEIKALFKDNDELAFYSCRIADTNGNSVSNFVWEESSSLSGKKFELSTSTQIPIGIDGVFYILFQVIDAEGNVTDKSIEFHVDA